MTASSQQAEQSSEIEAVEAALAHLNEVEQRYARAEDTEEGVTEDLGLARAAAFEAYNDAVNQLPEADFKTYVPF